MSIIKPPINLKKWIKTYKSSLLPPVCNKVIWANETFIVMVVGGPNVRKDFHINKTEELFFQIKGNMILKIMDKNNNVKNISIKEGELFLLPPMVPHSPQRLTNTIGLLVEAIRTPDQFDGFRWYCDHCNNVLYEEFLYVHDIEKQLSAVFKNFKSNNKFHQCKKCGEFLDVKN
jgi:3-hydroxyanthranilate 3,4-dioxygenase